MLALALATTIAFAWDERGPEGVPTGRTVQASEHFSLERPTWTDLQVSTDPVDLGAVAAATAKLMREQLAEDPDAVDAGMFSELGVSIFDVIETLELVARVASADQGNVDQRLLDPQWLLTTFEVLRWAPDTAAAAARKVSLTGSQIRLTKYLVYQVEGSLERSEVFDTALYADPGDEQRARWTRPEVYAGVFDVGGTATGAAVPLVWLSREGVNQALMQGTIEVRLPNGGTHLFNVHRNNGRAYDPGQRDGNLQERYWYFRKVDGVLGIHGIPLRAEAAVAGDVFNVGLGKLVALRTHDDELRLAVLADTGGAFQPNLFQLDWLAGAFPDHAAFAAHTKDLPTRVPAAVLIRRTP